MWEYAELFSQSMMTKMQFIDISSIFWVGGGEMDDI